MLGTRTGWSHREITALPQSLFAYYVRVLTNTNEPDANP